MLVLALPQTQATRFSSYDAYEQTIKEAIRQAFDDKDSLIAANGMIDVPLTVNDYDEPKLANTIQEAVLDEQLSIPEFRCIVDPLKSMSWELKQTEAGPFITLKLPIKDSPTHTKAAAAATALATYAPALPDLDKIDYYIKCLHVNASYDYEAANDPDPTVSKRAIDPAIALGAMPNADAVCESYARALQMLCDRTVFQDENLRCITVLGEINGVSHMYNMVSVLSDDLKTRLWLICDPTSAKVAYYPANNVSNARNITSNIYTYGITRLSDDAPSLKALCDNIATSVPRHLRTAFSNF